MKLTRRGLIKGAGLALAAPYIVRPSFAQIVQFSGAPPVTGGYNNLTNWPSAVNRPTLSGQTLSWIGPIGGGPSTANDVAQTRTLTNSGSVSSSSNGQVIQGLKITGAVFITHNNVTLKQCAIINGNGTYNVKIMDQPGPPTGCVVEDCYVDGSQNSDTAVWGGGTGAIYRRMNVFNSVDIFLGQGDNQLYIDNWAHDPYAPNLSHVDVFTNDGQWNNITLRHNWLATNGPTNTTGCCTFDPNFSDINGATVDNNYMIGGTFGLRFGSTNSLFNASATNNYFDLSLGGSVYSLDTPGGGTVQIIANSGNVNAQTLASVDSQIFGRP